MDGTLVLSDTLHESLLVLLRRQPLWLFVLPLWLLRGKAAFKRAVAARVQVDPATLPLNVPFLAWLRERHARPGRGEIVLCTAADAAVAQAVAGHLGLFDAVIASDGGRNLAGPAKAQALVQRYGERGFDYAGNSAADLAVWQQARGAVVVNAPARLLRAARAQAQAAGAPVQVIAGARPTLWTWLRALRLHQWVKNLLVFVPLLGAHLWFDTDALGHALLAFLAFGLCASSVYLLNDLMDLAADRAHPRKRQRPFAAGQLPLAGGLLAPVLLIAAFALALQLPDRFIWVLAGYWLLTLAYTFRLKQVPVLDVVVLAALYTSRIIAGAVAVPVAASFWLLALSMFLFLSLALVKRYAELLVMRDSGVADVAGRGYRSDDLPMVGSLGVAAGFLSVLVLALYVNSGTEGTALYGQPTLLWLLCPLLLYWIGRMWILTHRGQMDDDPMLFAVRDKASLIVAGLAAAIAVAAL